MTYAENTYQNDFIQHMINSRHFSILFVVVNKTEKKESSLFYVPFLCYSCTACPTLDVNITTFAEIANKLIFLYRSHIFS